MAIQQDTDSKVFTKRVENMVRTEKKRLVFRETWSSVLSPITSILAPWTGRSLTFLGSYAGVRHGSEYVREAKMYEEDIDYRRIGNKLFQEFAREADTTMPEIEREAKDATFLKGCIDKLSQESVRYIRSKTQMTGGWIGMGISMVGMTIPSLLKTATLGIGGTVGSLATIAGIALVSATASLGMSLSIAKRRRRFMTIHNRNLNSRWRNVDRAKYATLANPALKSITNSTDRMFKKLDTAVAQETTAFQRAITTLKSAMKGISLTSMLVNAGVLGTCYATGMDIATIATVFMGTSVMNNSVVRILDAHYRLKETADGMNDQYQKFRHNRIYDLSYGNEHLPDNTNAIRLTNICYCHRYKGDDKKNLGVRTDKPTIQSDKTITFGPGINVLGGPSGSGKSTLYKLLRHADDLSYGAVSYGVFESGKFNGVRTVDTGKEDIYKHIAFCLQDIDNDGQTGIEIIKQANPYMKTEHIEAIAAQLELSLYKETPQGQEPKLYRELSGGEKKRVLFLQTYLSPKRILVFDEPTSGVDEATAGKMIDMLNHDSWNIDGKSEKRTIIYTTHHPEELRKLNVTQVVDLAPCLDDENKVQSFIQTHGVTTYPSQLTVYPFQTEEEKDKYILLASSRDGKSKSSSTASINVPELLSLSIAERWRHEQEIVKSSQLHHTGRASDASLLHRLAGKNDTK